MNISLTHKDWDFWLFARSVCNMHVCNFAFYRSNNLVYVMYVRTCAALRLRSRRAIEMFFSATPLRETRCYVVV